MGVTEYHDSSLIQYCNIVPPFWGIQSRHPNFLNSDSFQQRAGSRHTILVRRDL